MKPTTVAFFLISFIIFTNSALACDKKITSKDIILFIDFNGSKSEIETARKAACTRGQELVVYPTQTKEVENIVNENVYYGNKKKALGGCLKYGKSPPPRACEKIEKEELKNILALDKMRKDRVLKQASEPELRAFIKNLKVINQKNVETLIISGHSAGGSYWGTYGFLRSENFHNAFKDLPDKGKSLNSIIFLACYSVNPINIIDWKKNIPSIKLMAGSDASAAAEGRPAALKYLNDILLKTNELTKDATEKSLEKKLNTLIPTLNQLNSSLYIDTNQCEAKNPNKNFFFSQAKGGLRKFSPEDCSKALDEYKKKEPEIRKYFNGDIEIPIETSGTPLRNLYTFMRQNEHCFKSLHGISYTADQLFGLLFYHPIKINAYRAYKKEFAEINSMFKNKEGLKKLVDDKFRKDEVEKFWPFTEENLKTKSRKEILRNLEVANELPYIISNSLYNKSHHIMIMKNIEKTIGVVQCYNPTWHDIQDSPKQIKCD